MSLLSTRNSKGTYPHPQSLALLNDAQYAHLKGSLLDTEALLLNLTEHFNPFNAKAIPGYRLLDNFPDFIPFHSCNHSSLNSYIFHLRSLDYLCLKASSSSSTLIVVTDTSFISPRNIQAVSTAYFWRLEQQMLFSKALAGWTTASNTEL